MEAFSVGRVPSLFQSSVLKVVESLPEHLDDISDLPVNVKDKILYLMTKRGLVTDDNISQVLHPRVKALDLSECDSIGDKSLFVIGKTCRNLQRLNLDCNKGVRPSVTTQGILNLVEGCPYLQTVFLRRCSNITDRAIIRLSEKCPNLRALNISGCTEITDKSLQALGENSSKLQSIDISYLQVTDDGILSLVSGKCRQTGLKEIVMNRCILLTDEAVEAVTHFCRHIDIFVFSGCPKITDRSRVTLEEVLGASIKMKQLTWTVY